MNKAEKPGFFSKEASKYSGRLSAPASVKVMFRKFLYRAFAILGTREVKSFERASLATAASQRAKLLEVVRANAQSEYGKDFHFASINNVDDFRQAVPVNDYDSLSQYINRSAQGAPSVLTTETPFMFATTSGTTGSRKLIPVTRSYIKEFRRASVVSGYNLLDNYPSVVNGVTLSVVSPAEESRTSAGIPVGAISGRLFKEEPKLIKRHISPIPYEVFLIEDYESKYYAILRIAINLPIACIYTLNPSTIVLLAKRLQTYGDRLVHDLRHGTISPPGAIEPSVLAAIKPALQSDRKRAGDLEQLLFANRLTAENVWPGLQFIACWTKAAAAFYLQDFPEHFGAVPVCDITYGASEGRGTVFLGPDRQALAVTSHFFEFVDEDLWQDDGKEELGRQTLLAHELEPGRNYHILFTTSGGLYRYHINDVVRCVGQHNQVPLIEFLHKGGNVSSFTGEKLTESQVTHAMSSTASELQLKVRFFTVVPKFRPQPHYELWIEDCRQDQSLEWAGRVAETFDRKLSEANSEYLTKRQSLRLGAVEVMGLVDGTYENVRKGLVTQGVPDAQIKLSHLNPKNEVLQELERFLRKETVAASPN